MRTLRDSFVARLLAGVLALVLGVLVLVSAVLLISRSQQNRGAALSNADNRAQVVRQLLTSLTQANELAVARDLAANTALAGALSQPDPHAAVPAAFAGAGRINPPGQDPVVVGPDGGTLFSTLSAGAALPPRPASVQGALAGRRDLSGVELLGGTAYYDSAEPISAGGRVIGAVVEVAQLSAQLQLFQSVVGYEVATIPVAGAGIARLGLPGSGSLPADLASAVASRQATVHATYSAPVPGGGDEDVAGSFVPVETPGGGVGAYIGVEAPLSLFGGDTRSDEITLALITIAALLVASTVVVLFVVRFVRRPVSRLERGVARIAGGDYTTDVPVTSGDELGRLAASVNRMRSQIALNIAAIEEGRARLDRAVEQLGRVSRALTTTTGGVEALQQAVVDAAASIAGHGAAALLLVREGEALVTQASHGVGGGRPTLDGWGVAPLLLAGSGARVDSAPPGWNAGGLLAVPMFYQEEVVGVLAVITRAGSAPADADAQSLAVLANSAAIAMENARLFEQERETVRRLTELDAMKTNFLATVQHELRTPLTAILGMSDLLEMAWSMWEDEQKLSALADIQMAGRNLYDIVETMIDFSLIEADSIGLNPAPTPLRRVVDTAVESVAGRIKGGIPVHVDVEVPAELTVYADADRLSQVLRALLDNAVKFTPEGGHVRILGMANGRPGMVEIDVVDDGIGIPGDALERIFERFYQVDNTATRRYGGTGMGLALVRRLVEAHGGRVEVASTQGEGSRFTLIWPAGPGDAAGEAGAVAQARGDA